MDKNELHFGENINWGIIGPGNIATSFAKDLAILPGQQQVKAILGNSREKMEEFRHEFGVEKVFTKLEHFVSDAGVDAVYIATPHPQHREEALACLNAGIPVLCEKPMTINADDCSQLISLSERNKTLLMEGMWIHFLPSIQKLLALLKEGRIGKIKSVKASVGYRAPDDPNSRYFDPALGGGSLLDLGIYPIYLAYLLMGKPDTIKAVGSLTEKGVDEASSVLFQYEDGKQAVLESTLLSETDQPAIITGENAVIRILDPWYEKSPGLEFESHDGKRESFKTSWEGHGLHFEALHFLDCLKKGKLQSDQLPLSFSLGMIEIMDEVRQQLNITYDMYE